MLHHRPGFLVLTIMDHHHIPMMEQQEGEEAYCCCGGSICQSESRRYIINNNNNHKDHFMQQARLMQLMWFIVAGFLFVVTALLALLLVFVFGNMRVLQGCQQCQHTPSADPSPAISAQQQKQVQVQQHQNPSAHLTVSTSTKEHHHLAWEHSDGNAHLRDFSYCNKYLTVPRDGFYRVYLQITYENPVDDDAAVDDCRNAKEDPDSHFILYHNVYHVAESYRTDVILMSAVHTVKCDVEYWQKSMYSGASFKLKEKDKLWVNSSHPSLIAVKEDRVFFGVDFQSE